MAIGDSTLNKKLVMVARDAAPSKIFKLLREALPDAVQILGDGFDIDKSDEEIREIVSSADILLLGMSHSPEAARVELLAGEVARDEADIVLFADSLFCSARSWFAPLRDKVMGVLTCTQSEAQRAWSFFPNAKTISTGNPLWEDNYYKVERYRRFGSEARNHIGVDADAFMVFVPLRKERDINTAHLKAVTIAISQLTEDVREKLDVCISTHPGEQSLEEGVEEYMQIIENFPECRILEAETPKMLASCDVIVNAASGVGLEAMYLGIPTIEFLPQIVLDELGKLQGGVSVWQPCEDHAAIETSTAGEISIMLEDVYTGGGIFLETTLLSQKKHYPPPTPPITATIKMSQQLKLLMEA